MEGKKNLCAMISTGLHEKIMAEKEQLDLNTLAEYVERIFTEHFEGGQSSMKAARTLAVQILSLIHSEMCIRDRDLYRQQCLLPGRRQPAGMGALAYSRGLSRSASAVDNT